MQVHVAPPSESGLMACRPHPARVLPPPYLPAVPSCPRAALTSSMVSARPWQWSPIWREWDSFSWRCALLGWEGWAAGLPCIPGQSRQLSRLRLTLLCRRRAQGRRPMQPDPR